MSSALSDPGLCAPVERVMRASEVAAWTIAAVSLVLLGTLAYQALRALLDFYRES